MTEEQKELLVYDLCGRLKYNIECQITYSTYKGKVQENLILTEISMLNKNSPFVFKTEEKWFTLEHECVKPYLRPISSMTEEEIEEFRRYCTILWNDKTDDTSYTERIIFTKAKEIEYLDKNGFDYRGLIRQGLAIDKTNEGISASKSVVGDICLCNKTTGKLLIVEAAKFSTTDYPSSAYSPVGVVVIPGSHNVYGDGSCGVMSMVDMSCDTPDTGGTSEDYMYWGVCGTDISTLPNLDQVCYVGSDGTVNNDVQGTTDYAFLPSDNFTTIHNPYDTGTYHKYNDNDYYIPSPFLTDGSRNTVYYQTASPSSTSNALSDFDGRGNTDKILEQRGTKDYSIWKPLRYNEDDYPSASCCDMYYTEGTKQGDWYLPACGELGYIMPNFNKINTTINTLANGYSVGVQLGSSIYYWSSSKCSRYSIRDIYTGNGLVGYSYGKNLNHYVRAFLRVK